MTALSPRDEFRMLKAWTCLIRPQGIPANLEVGGSFLCMPCTIRDEMSDTSDVFFSA